MSDESKDMLKLALATAKKQFGDGAVFISSERTYNGDIISTGNLQLDLATGIGGLPRGKIVEVFGLEGSGKSTTTLTTIAEAQKLGLKALLVDVEHSYDKEYAKNLGVKIDELLISQPNCGEEALEITDIFSRSGAVQIIVVDSIAALVPQAEIEGEIGQATMGLQARLMGQAMRKLCVTAANNNVLIIFTNQIRMKMTSYGNPETVPGGYASRFFASIRIDCRRTGFIKEGDNILGVTCKYKICKNKCAAPYQEAEFSIIFGKGFDQMEMLINLASGANIIEKAGAWYSYKGEKLGQGLINASKFLTDNPKIYNEIEVAVRTFMRPNG